MYIRTMSAVAFVIRFWKAKSEPGYFDFRDRSRLLSAFRGDVPIVFREAFRGKSKGIHSG